MVKKGFLFIFTTFLFLLSTSCSTQMMKVETRGISIASRGASLGSTVIAPDPVVLPASNPVAVGETNLVENILGECSFEENLRFEAEVAVLVNEARVSAGITRLSEHALLTQAARHHSAEMACGGFLSHDSPTGGMVDLRVEQAGYQFSAVGENIAMGYNSPEEVVAAWLASEGHRENILSEVFTQIGIGFVQLHDDEQTYYWTLILATPAIP
jgi:uncharacterized protein YkwD